MKKIDRASRKSKAIRTTNTIVHQQQRELEERLREEKSIPNLEKKLAKIVKQLKNPELTTTERYELRKELSVIKAEIATIQLRRKYGSTESLNTNNDDNSNDEPEISEIETTTCKECESTDIIHDTKMSQMICQECGYSEFYLDDDTPQWSDEVQVSTPFKYTRINNFRVHLQRLQGVEAKTIPDEVIENLRQAFADRCIDLSRVTRKMIRDRLKDLGFKDNIDHTKFYNNGAMILSKLTNQKPPILSQEFIEELERDFLKIEKSFEKHKDKFEKNRSHFFSYNFIFTKLFLRMQLKYPEDENIPKLISHFPLLKNRQKLIEQERVFAYIAKDLGWIHQRTV